MSGNLDRIQIVKGWIDAKGARQEKIYDVAWSDNRKPGADGKLPAVGNTVDVANATWTNTIGAAELITVWKDPSFDPSLRAVYYARVIEIPTPRWTAYDANRFKVRGAGGRADDHTGARLHFADLVHAVSCLCNSRGRQRCRPLSLVPPMKLLREPLLHFALVGALLFGAHAWLNRDQSPAIDGDHTIRITERELTWLAATSARTTQRAPSDSEFQLLIAEYLREELLAREARELELDKDDTIVRRRLAQKMNFILENTARLATPSDADLRARFAAEQARFRTPVKSTFHQIPFTTSKRGDRAAADARRALGQLARGGKSARMDELGDASLLPQELTDADEAQIANQFGTDFARAVGAIAPGAWHGPIQSEFGVHLVLVTARDEGRTRAFEEVQSELKEEWQREQAVSAKNSYFAGLLRKYDVQATEKVQHLLGPALSLLKGAE